MGDLDTTRDELLDEQRKLRSRLRNAAAEHARTLAQLKTSEARYQDLYDNARDMFVSVESATGSIVECNQTLATAIGSSKEKLLGRPVVSLYHADCIEHVKQVCASLERTGEVREVELQLERKDGRTIDVSVNVSAVRDRTGRVVGSRSILRDITKRKQAEAALRASRERYENLYADAPDMFASVEVATERIVQCNRTLTRAAGYARDALLGRPVRELHHPTCWRDFARAIEDLRATGRVRDIELQLQRKDGGAIEVSLSAAAVRDEQDNLYYRCTWRDITERRRAQVAIQRKQRELERSQQELEALAARLLTVQEDERRRISRELHDDVNQRLALLTFEIETLERDLPRSRPATVARLRELRERVVTLSDDVHSLAYQFHPAILDDLGLTAALESLTDDFTRREGIEIDVAQSVREKIAPEVAYCFYRVAQEALRNVARHARAERVTLRLEQGDDGISLVISDTGVGFELEVSDKRRRGLGVVGMQERVRLVNGRFSVTSRVGEGTRVQAWVPLPKEVT